MSSRNRNRNESAVVRVHLWILLFLLLLSYECLLNTFLIRAHFVLRICQFESVELSFTDFKIAAETNCLLDCFLQMQTSHLCLTMNIFSQRNCRQVLAKLIVCEAFKVFQWFRPGYVVFCVFLGCLSSIECVRPFFFYRSPPAGFAPR